MEQTPASASFRPETPLFDFLPLDGYGSTCTSCLEVGCNDMSYGKSLYGDMDMEGLWRASLDSGDGRGLAVVTGTATALAVVEAAAAAEANASGATEQLFPAHPEVLPQPAADPEAAAADRSSDSEPPAKRGRGKGAACDACQGSATHGTRATTWAGRW